METTSRVENRMAREVAQMAQDRKGGQAFDIWKLEGCLVRPWNGRGGLDRRIRAWLGLFGK